MHTSTIGYTCAQQTGRGLLLPPPPLPLPHQQCRQAKQDLSFRGEREIILFIGKKPKRRSIMISKVAFILQSNVMIWSGVCGVGGIFLLQEQHDTLNIAISRPDVEGWREPRVARM